MHDTAVIHDPGDVGGKPDAPSRSPPAKPIVQALSRSLICASFGMPDAGCGICVRRDWALPMPQSAIETIATIAILDGNIIGISILLNS
jgi:hypothetical protein